ncbi:MAG: HYR domain-containing protein [Bacteroidia bacterium]
MLKYIYIFTIALLMGGVNTLVAQSFPVTISKLPPGKKIIICFKAEVDQNIPGTATQVSSQGAVNSQYGTVTQGRSTDDPDDPTSAFDPTITEVDVCNITGLTVTTAPACDANGNYSVSINIAWEGAPPSGAGFQQLQLRFNGLVVATYTPSTASGNHTVNLINQAALGQVVNAVADFNATCSKTENALFTMPDASTAPTATCKPTLTIWLNNVGAATLTPDSIDTGSFDGCGDVTLGISPTSLACSDVGTPVDAILTVTDKQSNVARCTTTVTVVDSIAPVVGNCVSDTVYANSTCEYTGNIPSNGGSAYTSSDNCSPAVYVVEWKDENGVPFAPMVNDTFAVANYGWFARTYPLGVNTVTVTVTDFGGNSGTCTATVTVLDTTSPMAVCQNATVYLDPAGSASINVSDVDNGSFDNCGVADTTVSPSMFGCGEVGPNTATLTATDSSGNMGTCAAVVTVIDSTKPVISCPAAIVQGNDPGMCGAQVTIPTVTADDNCGGTVSVQSAVTPYASRAVNASQADTTTLSIPVALLPASSDGMVGIYARGDLDRMLQFDDERFDILGEDGSVLGTTLNTPINCDPAYTKTNVTITMAQLNAWSADGMIDIRLAPIQPGAIFLLCSGGNDAYATLDYEKPVAITNDFDAGGADAAGMFAVGTQSVLFTAMDPSGNMATCSVSVTVNDTESPTIAFCPPSMEVCEDDTVRYMTPLFNDNCDGMNLRGTKFSGLDSGTVFPVGGSVVEYEYQDLAGNAITRCVFVVTVHPKPNAPNTQLAICDGDSIGFDLQMHIDTFGNGVKSSFMWQAMPVAGITGISTSTQTDTAITDVLVNTTLQVKTVIYTITPTSDTGNCVGPDFLVRVRVRPSTKVAMLPADVCPGGMVDIATLLRDYSLLAVSARFYDADPATGASSIGFMQVNRGVVRPIRNPGSPFGANVLVSPAQTTTYWVTAYTRQGCEQTLSFVVTVLPTCNGTIAPIAILQGAYDQTLGQQRTTLQQQSLVPAAEPYTSLGYTFKGGGGETMNLPAGFQGGIVDWVVVELRDKLDATHVVYSRAALLLDNGMIVDMDGVSNPAMTAKPTEQYYVAIIHRNHLGVMTAQPVSIGTTVDFSDPNLAMYGTTGTRVIQNGKALLFAGDADGNGQVQNTDDVMQWSPNAGSSGYKAADYNLDGQVQNTDRVLIWTRNVGRGSSVPK